jgi:hypothetical protein
MFLQCMSSPGRPGSLEGVRASEKHLQLMVPLKTSSIPGNSICPCLLTRRKRCFRRVLLAVMFLMGRNARLWITEPKSNNAVFAALTASFDALVAAKDNEAQGTTEGADNRNNNALRQRPCGPGELNLSTLIWSLGYVGQTGETNRSDLNSHADCSVAGLESLVLLDWDRPCVVSSYDPAQKPKTLMTVSAALTHEFPKIGRTVCLILHQAIYLPTLQHNLLCPMQMRLHGVVVNETPRLQCESPTESSHSVVARGVSVDETITMPLFLKGLTSCMTTGKLIKFELENCEHFELTAKSPAYDPHC